MTTPFCLQSLGAAFSGPLPPLSLLSSQPTPPAPADPPLDLLLLWHIPSSSAPGWTGRERFGIVQPKDARTGGAKEKLQEAIGYRLFSSGYTKRTVCTHH